ncbi:quinon protein alcohol dehydrogenase-like superfamily [Chiua virens]|nr:quinon protein alcohol dehydrogenase-like superfamily [Chiua virens]
MLRKFKLKFLRLKRKKEPNDCRSRRGKDKKKMRSRDDQGAGSSASTSTEECAIVFSKAEQKGEGSKPDGEEKPLEATLTENLNGDESFAAVQKDSKDSAVSSMAEEEEERANQDGQVDGLRTIEDTSVLTRTISAVNVIEIDGQRHITSVVFMDNGKHVLAGDREGKIRCWRVDDGKEVGLAMDAGDEVYDIAVSQDSKWIVTGAYGGFAGVFDAESRKLVKELKGHKWEADAVDVSLDGTKIVSGSDDGTVRVWSLASDDGLQLLQDNRDGHCSCSKILAQWTAVSVCFV